MDCIGRMYGDARRERFTVARSALAAGLSVALGASLRAQTTPPDAEKQAIVTAEKRPLIAPDSPIKPTEQNLLRVITKQHGLGRDFSVLLDDANPGTKATLRTAAAAKGPEDAIELEGVAYFRGWRPMSLGPRVRIGAEGSSMVVEVQTSATGQIVERAHFVGGVSLSIEPRPGVAFAAGSDARPLRTPGTFFEVTSTSDSTVVTVKRHALTATPSASDKVETYPDAAALEKIRQTVESITQRAEALNVGKDQQAQEHTP